LRGVYVASDFVRHTPSNRRTKGTSRMNHR
jgi:hypothetical protein